MTRWLETDSNTNIDISAATVVGSYTADADRLVVPQLLIDQAAGNGDYVYYVALQVNGSGSWYVIGPKTTHTAASGETAIGAQGGAVAMRSGDVLRVYVDGLAGDISTPDVVVRFFEYQPVREALATELGRVDAAVSSRLAAASYSAPPSASDNATAAAAAILAAADSDPISANVTLWKGDAVADLVNGAVPSNLLRWLDGDVSEQLPQVIPIIDDGEGTQQLTQQVLRDAMMLAPSARTAEAGSVDALLNAATNPADPWAATLPGGYAGQEAGAILGRLAELGAGSGTGYYSDTVADGADPLDGVRVQLSTDAAGTNRVYEAWTDALGQFELWPDPGTYYLWLDLAGYAFTQGVEVEVPEL